MPKQHRRRTRTVVLVLGVLGVLGAGFAGVASAQTVPWQHSRPAASQHRQQVGGAATLSRHRSWRHHPRPTGSAPTPPSTPPTPIPPKTPPTQLPDPPKTIPPTTKPTTQAPTSPPLTSVIDQVLAHINIARTANGLQPLTLSANLSNASVAHNNLMINGCGLSHQCPGEASLGDRFTAAGASWTSAGENIGLGSSGASDAQIVAAANGLTDSMLAEQPPNDGHRRNLLNTGYKKIGLAVARDSKGVTWMTQDFVN
ncbi:MAG: hypothetical protein QOH97_5252 [Actinoplanes sp.]|nr:hypothetical protein [Actinoplanes sp.]